MEFWRHPTLTRIFGWYEREWRFCVGMLWAATICLSLWLHWSQIDAFWLFDTDDNIRLQQVRDWIGGQGWYDLRQYRLHPPQGANIHWTRLVDLPLALMILALTPLFGVEAAETAATALAPLLPLGLTYFAFALLVRRTISSWIWPLACGLILAGEAAEKIFAPMRIDHHGWQLAFLACLVAGLALDDKRRSGAIVGGATALSLTIGLEMLPYLAIGGAIVTLRWIWNRAEAQRLSAYALSLGGGTALGFLIFASNDNWAMRCDALTPVWLSAMVLSGGLLLLAALANPSSWAARLGLAGLAGGAVILLMAGAFPQCIAAPEGISDDAKTLWFSHVREVKPLAEQGADAIAKTLWLPISGILGALLMLFRDWRRGIASPWFGMLALMLAATLMLTWQYRVASIAELLAVPGATALAWLILVQLTHFWRVAKEKLALTLLTFAVVGGLIYFADELSPPKKANNTQQNFTRSVNTAFARCMSLPNLHALNAFPTETILTFVDLGPRLLVTTHHRALSGPYHRNDAEIVAIHKAFKGTAEEARATARKYGATMLLDCPNLAEATLHNSRKGFYHQLVLGKKPDWLEPLDLPKGSPFKLWRILP